jgi:arginase family protein
LASSGHPVWLHLDVDVLDPDALPAVTYPQSEGLDWDQLEAVMQRVAQSPSLIGVSVADFRPEWTRPGNSPGAWSTSSTGPCPDQPEPICTSDAILRRQRVRWPTGKSGPYSAWLISEPGAFTGDDLVIDTR